MAQTQKSLEFQGADVEEAIANALKSLNVSREMISVKIVCEEQKGLFKMSGAKPARIKVSLK